MGKLPGGGVFLATIWEAANDHTPGPDHRDPAFAAVDWHPKWEQHDLGSPRNLPAAEAWPDTR